jgi:hypothetical protein
MKKLILVCLGLLTLALPDAFASNAPRGRFLELHSCRVYAGGCLVSSESTLDGRYMLRVWDFAEGAFGGSDFQGLQVALLQTGSENLAEKSTQPTDTVIYHPESASAKQRASLLAWLKSTLPALNQQTTHTRVAPLRFTRDGLTSCFTAGNLITVKVATLESCPMGGCGEQLWYRPRTPSTFFTVGVNARSQVQEPLLKLHWEDGGKATVFLARFGEPTLVKNLYVSTADFCGTSGTLF